MGAVVQVKLDCVTISQYSKRSCCVSRWRVDISQHLLMAFAQRVTGGTAETGNLKTSSERSKGMWRWCSIHCTNRGQWSHSFPLQTYLFTRTLGLNCMDFLPLGNSLNIPPNRNTTKMMQPSSPYTWNALTSTNTSGSTEQPYYLFIKVFLLTSRRGITELKPEVMEYRVQRWASNTKADNLEVSTSWLFLQRFTGRTWPFWSKQSCHISEQMWIFLFYKKHSYE